MVVGCIVVDPQCSFSELCPAELPVSGAQYLAKDILSVLAVASVTTLSKEVHDRHAPWVTEDPTLIGAPLSGYPHAVAYWPAHCVMGTQGVELLPDLPPVTDFDFVVYKGIEPTLHPFGACYHDTAESISTGLIEFLQAREVDTVLVCGVATDYCVRYTALQLQQGAKPSGQKFERVIVCEFASRGVGTDTTKAALIEMATAGILIATSPECLHAMLSVAP